MRLGLDGDDALNVLDDEVVARRVVLRSKLLDDGALRKGYVVLVGRDNLVGVFLGRLLDHGEERRRHFLAVNDERTAENLVTAVLGVDLRKAEHFGVGQFAAQLLLDVVQVVDFLGREGQTFLLVVAFQVVDIFNGSRLDVDGKDVLVQPLVHALQHGVVVGVLIFYGEVFLNARNAVEIHVLRNLNGICTPGGNHFATGAYKVAFQLVCIFHGSAAIEPAQFVFLFGGELMVNLRCDDALSGCSEK